MSRDFLLRGLRGGNRVRGDRGLLQASLLRRVPRGPRQDPRAALHEVALEDKAHERPLPLRARLVRRAASSLHSPGANAWGPRLAFRSLGHLFSPRLSQRLPPEGGIARRRGALHEVDARVAIAAQPMGVAACHRRSKRAQLGLGRSGGWGGWPGLLHNTDLRAGHIAAASRRGLSPSKVAGLEMGRLRWNAHIPGGGGSLRATISTFGDHPRSCHGALRGAQICRPHTSMPHAGRAWSTSRPKSVTNSEHLGFQSCALLQHGEASLAVGGQCR